MAYQGGGRGGGSSRRGGGAGASSEAATAKQPAWLRADPRFFWNRLALKPLLVASDSAGAAPVPDDFVTQVVSAFVGSCSGLQPCVSPPAAKAEAGRAAKAGAKAGSGPSFTLLVVSRRSCKRQGTRFLRGVDALGNVANFVETEQLVFNSKTGGCASFVQVPSPPLDTPLLWRPFAHPSLSLSLDGWMDGRTDGCMDGSIDQSINRSIDHT